MAWLAEAHAAYPWQLGHLYPERAWLLSPFDVWQRNPYYQGPPVPHPEDPANWEEEAQAVDEQEEAHWQLVLAQADAQLETER